MNKMVIVLLDSERGAYEGTRVLKELHDEGHITLYAQTVIAKDSGGKGEGPGGRGLARPRAETARPVCPPHPLAGSLIRIGRCQPIRSRVMVRLWSNSTTRSADGLALLGTGQGTAR